MITVIINDMYYETLLSLWKSIIQIVTYAASSSSSPFSIISELVHPDPLQLPQTTEHFTSCFLYVHLILLQSVWQLHLIILRNSFGAGGKSVSNGIKVFHHSFSFPIQGGSFHHYFLSTLIFENKLEGCGIL